MGTSLIDQFLEAIDRLDAEAAAALMAPECRLLTMDGRRAEGIDAVRALLTEVLSEFRSCTHRVSAQWHQDGVWIAEVVADYELEDWRRITALPRAFVLRSGGGGLTDVHVYGAHEERFRDEGSEDRGMVFGGRWMPSL